MLNMSSSMRLPKTHEPNNNIDGIIISIIQKRFLRPSSTKTTYSY